MSKTTTGIKKPTGSYAAYRLYRTLHTCNYFFKATRWRSSTWNFFFYKAGTLFWCELLHLLKKN